MSSPTKYLIEYQEGGVWNRVLKMFDSEALAKRESKFWSVPTRVIPIQEARVR